MTAAEVAEELEVSVKTARRDLEALAIAGIPVYSQAGKNGGWSLVGGARTDLSGLTADEAQGAVPARRAVGGAHARRQGGPAQAGPGAPRDVPLGGRGRGGGDRPRPGRRGAPTDPAPPAHLDVLQRAVIDGVQVRLGYSDRTRTQTDRTVHPLGLVEKGSVWYLVAGTEAGMRTFRLSRVQSVEVTGEPVERPPDFDLAATWQEVGGDDRGAADLGARHRACRPARGPAGSGPSSVPASRACGDGLADGRVEVEIGTRLPEPDRRTARRMGRPSSRWSARPR